MAETADLSPTIVEGLYCEALTLADEARAAFQGFDRHAPANENDDLARVAISCEALRTTTRMMHAIAWLLNQRAYFAGELSEFQLRRHGRLPRPQDEGVASDPDMFGPAVLDLIERTRLFYARIERLDHAWRDRVTMDPSAILQLRERLGAAVGHL